MFAKWYHKIVTLPCQCDGHYAKVETERLKDPNKLKWKNSRDISISTKRAKSTRFFTLNELSCLDTSSNALRTLFENFALNLCQLPPAFFCLFNLSCHSLLRKKQKHYFKTPSFMKEQRAPERGGSIMKENMAPGSSAEARVRAES